MSTPRMTEKELAEHQRRVRISRTKTGWVPKATHVGVKEHTANGGRGRGAVSDRRPASTGQDTGTTVKSSARTLHATNPYAPYANEWEFNYAKVLDLELRVGAITSWTYETITFRLAYRQYHRSDFVIGHTNGTAEIRQVKGWHKNLRAGIKGLKWAAQKWPMFRWTIYRWTGSGWDGNDVEV